jgi:hypothetical protein
LHDAGGVGREQQLGEEVPGMDPGAQTLPVGGIVESQVNHLRPALRGDPILGDGDILQGVPGLEWLFHWRFRHSFTLVNVVFRVKENRDMSLNDPPQRSYSIQYLEQIAHGFRLQMDAVHREVMAGSLVVSASMEENLREIRSMINSWIPDEA